MPPSHSLSCSTTLTGALTALTYLWINSNGILYTGEGQPGDRQPSAEEGRGLATGIG
ncbi:MAG TPA: hypothetical protein VFG62_24965 [Rhodopila sp.]|jgi:hypothetical protein|nr:hypothetical protein [Rhodopila sp.]